MVRAPPVGLGYPVFDKLEAELAKALMSLPATKARACRVQGLQCHLAQDSTVSQGAHECPPARRAPVRFRVCGVTWLRTALLATALMSLPATKVCVLAAAALRRHSVQDSTIVQATVGAGSGWLMASRQRPGEASCSIEMLHDQPRFLPQGFEIGSGFAGAAMTGLEHNDEFEMRDGRVRTKTNRSGGVQGEQINRQGEGVLASHCVFTCRTGTPGQRTSRRAPKEWASACSGKLFCHAACHTPISYCTTWDIRECTAWVWVPDTGSDPRRRHLQRRAHRAAGCVQADVHHQPGAEDGQPRRGGRGAAGQGAPRPVRGAARRAHGGGHGGAGAGGPAPHGALLVCASFTLFHIIPQWFTLFAYGGGHGCAGAGRPPPDGATLILNHSISTSCYRFRMVVVEAVVDLVLVEHLLMVRCVTTL